MTTAEDEVTTLLRDMVSAGSKPGAPVTAAEVRRRAGRRRSRRGDAKVLVALAAVAAVFVTLITVGPLRSSTGPRPTPVATRPTGTSPGSTTTTTTTTTTVPAAAASALDTYVAQETQTDAAPSPAAGHGTDFVSVHSPPVADDGVAVAVAAFSYDPAGHFVQVLEYRGGRWTQAAGLPPPTGQAASAAEARSFLYLTADPVSVADVTDDGRPDFLVMASAADNVPGFVVSEAGGTWHYIPFLGPDAPTPTDVISRDPRFQDGTVVSGYDNCVPDCASGASSTIVWTYQPATGRFTAPDPPGYVTPPTVPGGG